MSLILTSKLRVIASHSSSHLCCVVSVLYVVRGLPSFLSLSLSGLLFCNTHAQNLDINLCAQPLCPMDPVRILLLHFIPAQCHTEWSD